MGSGPSSSDNFEERAHLPPPNTVRLVLRSFSIRDDDTNKRYQLTRMVPVSVPHSIRSTVNDYVGNYNFYNALMMIDSPDPVVYKKATSVLLNHRTFTDTETLAFLAAYAHVSKDVVEKIFETNDLNLRKWFDRIRRMYANIIHRKNKEKSDNFYLHNPEQSKRYMCERSLPLGLKAMTERLRDSASKMTHVHFDFESYNVVSHHLMYTLAFAGLDLFAPNVEVVAATMPYVYTPTPIDFSMRASHDRLRAYYELHHCRSPRRLDVIAVSFIAGRESEMRDVIDDLDFIKGSMWTSWLTMGVSRTNDFLQNNMLIGLQSMYPAERFNRLEITRKYVTMDAPRYDFKSSIRLDGKIVLLFDDTHELDKLKSYGPLVEREYFAGIFESRRPENVRDVEHQWRDIVAIMASDERPAFLEARAVELPTNPLLQVGMNVADLNRALDVMRNANPDDDI